MGQSFYFRLRAEQKAVEARRAVELAVQEHKAETTALQSSAKEHRLKAENLSETVRNASKITFYLLLPVTIFKMLQFCISVYNFV